MKRVFALILAASCVFAMPGCKRQAPIVQNDMPEEETYAVALASYPEMASYPDHMDFTDEKTGDFDNDGFSQALDRWSEGRQTQRNQPEGYADGLEAFFQKSMVEFLGDAQGENKIFSPVNVYMALSMLAETTGGDSRQQILTLLEADSMDALREQVNSVWNANYCDDGMVVSRLANSLWLNQDLRYQTPTAELLARQYHASVFSGEMGSAAYNQVLRDWLNEQTGNLLEDQISQVEMQPETQLALASTIYFQGNWHLPFSKEKTRQQPFHAEQGDISCEFMHQQEEQTYYWAEHFSAVAQQLNSGGQMWLLLPDEGITVEQLLADPQVATLLAKPQEWKDSKNVVVNLKMPKFDISSELDLAPGLQSLGVTRVFDRKAADFSGIFAEGQEAFLSQVDHGARVAVDENGVVATAYTMMTLGMGESPDEEVEFVLDRPFLFIIASRDDLPLFAGVVNQPE